MSKNIIEIDNLSKFYGKQRGIEDVTFSVGEGEIFGFIGPNGAGKSTTIRTCKRQVLFLKKRHFIFPKCGKLFSSVCGILFSRIYGCSSI